MKRRLLRSERGAAVVEFTLIAVALLTIVFGIIELGILMFDQHVLTNASREGARTGIVMRNPRVSNADITSRVEKYAKAHMVTFGAQNAPKTTLTWFVYDPDDRSKLIATLNAPSTEVKFGDDLKVAVSYDFDFLFLSIVGLGPIKLKAETLMRME